MTDLLHYKPRRILVCQLRQLGDVLLATPALELLKRRYPEASIDFLTEKKCTPLVENHPALERIWSLDKHSFKTLAHELAWYWQVARSGYDLVVDFQQLPRCRWVVAFSGAEVRLSYTPPWYTRWLYSHSVPMQDGYAAMSKASVLAPLGIHWQGERPRLYLRQEERDTAHRFLDGLDIRPENILLTLDTTHRHETRRWPAHEYARLLILLAQRNPLLRFLALWGPGEEPEAREVLTVYQQLASPDITNRLLLLPHLLPLRQVAACIQSAAIHIGNCSAPRHMAVAVDTPSLTLLGASGHAWTFPAPEHQDIMLGLDCQPCNRSHCLRPATERSLCLTSVHAAEVLPRAEAMLQGYDSSPKSYKTAPIRNIHACNSGL